MLRKLLLVALTLAPAALALSCGSPRTNYYRLHYPVAENAANAASGGTLAVERLRAPQLLRQDRIVYSTAGQQLNYYQYHRWADDPGAMVTTLLVRELQGRRLFKDVYTGPSDREPDYTLRGRLLSLEEVDRGANVTAHVALEAVLVKTKTGAVIWSGRAEQERPVSRKDVSTVVEEMSQAARDAIGQIADGITQTLAREGR